MSDQSKKSLISYLEPISGPKCTCILKLRSTEMQCVKYPPTLFYYSFSQYIIYVNIKRNEISIFLFSKATKYTQFLGLHLLVQMHLLCHDWIVPMCSTAYITSGSRSIYRSWRGKHLAPFSEYTVKDKELFRMLGLTFKGNIKQPMVPTPI